MTEAHACCLCGAAMPGTAPPSERRFCCYGCLLAYQITGEGKGEGKASLFLAKLGIAAFFSVNAMTIQWALYGESVPLLFPVEEGMRTPLSYVVLVMSLPVYLLVGIPFLRNALCEVRAGHAGVDTLVAVGTTAALVVSVWSTISGDYHTYYDSATMVLVLITFGRYLEATARLRAEAALAKLVRGTPVKARRVGANGEQVVDAAMLVADDVALVLPGEEVPADGVIINGDSSFDESMLSGEHLPQNKGCGDEVFAGTFNCGNAVTIQVARPATGSIQARLTAITRAVRSRKMPVELAAEKIARLLTPSVAVAALAVFAFHATTSGAERGLLAALSVLLIACPCALGIGMSLASAIGYGQALARGILLRSLSALEHAARVSSVLLDKTGTITTGRILLERAVPLPGTWISREEALDLAASLEKHSHHPFARALVASAHAPGRFALQNVVGLPGHGVKGCWVSDPMEMHEVQVTKPVNGKPLLFPAEDSDKPAAVLTIDQIPQFLFIFNDPLRPSAASAVHELGRLRIPCGMVSGDRCEVVSVVAREAGIKAFLADLRPEGKLAAVEHAERDGPVAMVGDGLNDAPALARATLGIALRGGSDLSREVAEVTLLDDDLLKVPWLLQHAKRVLQTIRWNLLWAFGYNAIGVALAAAGVLTPVLAALFMVLSSGLVIVSSARLAHSA